MLKIEDIVEYGKENSDNNFSDKMSKIIKNNEINNILHQELKQKVIFELERSDFPNLWFLYSEEVLDNAERMLLSFLTDIKKEFEEDLKIEDKDIDFNIFVKKNVLYKFWSLLSHLSWVNDSDKIREIKDNVLPKLIDFGNDVSYSKRYFDMLEICLNKCDLDLEQTKIISDQIKDFKIRWINLNSEKQEELKNINSELSELTKNFSQNILDSEKEFEYFLETDEFLKEFPKSNLQDAKDRAKQEWKEWYLFDSSSWSYNSIMSYCSNSDIRKYFSDAKWAFASKWKFDNRSNALNIIKLENKKVDILWYKNQAEFSLVTKMAESPEQVVKLLELISKKAKLKAINEIDELKEYFDLTELNSWDTSYYFRLLKKHKYNLDSREMKKYFEYENTKNGLFETVKKLYNIDMIPLKVEWKYNKDLEIYEVFKDGNLISYFIWDYFNNKNKKSWAWADDIRKKWDWNMPVVVNVMSIDKAKKWNTLMTLDDTTTMFHEMGHAIHLMLSKSKYSELSWFWIEWDAVELPSQILEKWVTDSESIVNIAKHNETWKSLPDEMIKSYKKLNDFWKWNHTLWQIIYWIIDLNFYSWKQFNSVEELDKTFLDKVNELSIFKKSDNYKMYANFSHIFWGGYWAWYYSYMWADLLVDDIWAKFKEKGIYNKEFALEFEEKILGAWSIKKASEMFKDLMWRDVEIDAFLKEKGLV